MKKSLFVLTALAVFAGCKTVQEARNVQKQDPAQYMPGERTVTPAEVGVTPGATLSITQLEAIALFSHPSILQARQNVELAELNVMRVKSNYKPTFAVNAGYARSTYNRDHNRPSWRTKESFTAAADFQMLLWDFGKTDSQIRQAALALVAAERRERESENRVLLNVRLAHSALVRASSLHQVALEAVAQYKEHLDQMKDRFEVGKGTDYDRVKAEVDWVQSQLEATTTSNNVETSKANLNRCLGFADDVLFRVEPMNVPHSTNTLEQLMARARENEPTLASLRAQEKAAGAAVDQAIANLYPDITLGVSMEAGSGAWPLLWNLTGLGLISQNIYNGGRDMLDIKSAVNELHIARSKVAEYEQTLFYNLRKALLDAQRAHDALEVAKRTESLSADNLRIVNERFAVGKASSIERTDAQVQHSNAQAAVVSATFDDFDAQSNIAYLIGD